MKTGLGKRRGAARDRCDLTSGSIAEPSRRTKRTFSFFLSSLKAACLPMAVLQWFCAHFVIGAGWNGIRLQSGRRLPGPIEAGMDGLCCKSVLSNHLVCDQKTRLQGRAQAIGTADACAERETRHCVVFRCCLLFCPLREGSSESGADCC